MYYMYYMYIHVTCIICIHTQVGRYFGCILILIYGAFIITCLGLEGEKQGSRRAGLQGSVLGGEGGIARIYVCVCVCVFVCVCVCVCVCVFVCVCVCVYVHVYVYV